MSEPTESVRLYHYQRLIGEWPTRFHLRVDPDGRGLLLANAAEAAYLSPVGVQMARGVLEGRSDAAIKQDIKLSFRGVSDIEIETDLGQVYQLIADLSAPGDNYPITNLNDPRASEWSREMAAPFRADVVPGEPDATKQLLQRLWEAGVPHVTIVAQPPVSQLVGGPSLARSGSGQGCPSHPVQGDVKYLPRMVEAAGDLGMITGLRAVASWLSPPVIEDAGMAGLDHLDLLYVSNSPPAHDDIAGQGDYERVMDAFAQCGEVELCPVAQIPLIKSNNEQLEEIMGALQEQGIVNLVFFALACPDNDEQAQAAGALPAQELPQVATVMTEAAEDTQARYLWAPPVRFDNTKSLAHQVCAGPRTAGDIAVRVEADGRVFAPRGRECAGNLLAESWQNIWNHECFTRYRQRLQAPTRCSDCPDLEICAADCPKDPRGWSDDTQGGEDQ